MKRNRLTVVAGVALCALTQASADQLLYSDWVNWIVGLQPQISYNGGLWPEEGLGARLVAHNLVPLSVWSEQQTWVSRVLRGPWVPANMRERSTAARFLGGDILVYRLHVAEWVVQITDNASSITVLAKPDSLFSGTSETRIRRALAEVTNFPEDKLGQLTIRARDKVIGGHAGFTFLGDAMGATPPGEHAWWQQIQGISDGRSLLLNFPKFDGTQKPTYATAPPPGGRLRFNLD